MEVDQDLFPSYREHLVQLGKKLRRGLKRWHLPPTGMLRRTLAFNKKFMTFRGVDERLDIKGHPRNSPQRFRVIILLLCVLTLTLIMYFSSNTSALSEIQPTTVQILHFDESTPSPDEMEQVRIKSNKMKGLAMNLITEIKQISSPRSCENRSTLYCGYKSECGLGCQLHHHATCLMLSYTMKLPLIHNTRGWPFGKWENTFQPLGSQCSTNEQTITVKWTKTLPLLSLNKSMEKVLEYPFKSGIPVDADFLQEIQKSHPEPFLWFVGQFLKYTMRLSWTLAPVVNDFLRQLPRNSSMVGFHIRRTDKVDDRPYAYHGIQDYMMPADAYFQNLNCSLNRTVYLASDDHELITEAEKLYPLPQWRFIGLKMNYTLHRQELRLNSRALTSIILDVEALTKCDYVVCGFSSNICRLVLELITADHIDGLGRVKSLDLRYPLKLQGHTIPRRLLPRSSPHNLI